MASEQDPFTLRLTMSDSKGVVKRWDLAARLGKPAALSNTQLRSYTKECIPNADGSIALVPEQLEIGTSAFIVPVQYVAGEIVVNLDLRHVELTNMRRHENSGGCSVDLPSTQKTLIEGYSAKLLLGQNIELPAATGDKYRFAIMHVQKP